MPENIFFKMDSMKKYYKIDFQLMNCFRHSHMPRAPQKASVVSFFLGGLRGTSAARGTLCLIVESRPAFRHIWFFPTLNANTEKPKEPEFLPSPQN